MRVPKPLARAAVTKRFKREVAPELNDIPEEELGVANAVIQKLATFLPLKLSCYLTEKQEVELREVDFLRRDRGASPVRIIRPSDERCRRIQITGDRERSVPSERRWESIFKVELAVSFGEIGREEFEQRGLVLVFGCRQDVS